MTGFAREAGTFGSLSWAWEIKSVNGRNLDVRVRVPLGFDASGEDARKVVSAAITRGAVQVGLTIQRSEQRKVGVKINTEVLASLVKAIGDLPSGLPINPASLDGLLQVRGVVEVDEQEEQGLPAELQALLLRGIEVATAAFVVARRQEGVALADLMTRQLAQMGTLVDAVETHPQRSGEAIRTRLQAQVSALLDAHATLDPGRLYQEAAIIATRADVREELDRLAAHVAAAQGLFAQGGAIGRKLDFLAQEFGREASTLCAKAGSVELSAIGLELRALVDQFREQAQNVE
jgi:uncharacterized protein (TIGR00255 family)